MATKHTPGPWGTRGPNGGSMHITGPKRLPNGQLHNGPPGDVIAFVAPCPEWEANGKLLSAAPDLLDACEKALELLEDDGHLPMAKKMRAAIAKARGI